MTSFSAQKARCILSQIDLIRQFAEPLYLGSKHYPLTVWPHALAVAEHAKTFARQLNGNLFVAEVAGLLHDIGAAMFGKDNHHITGAEVATSIMLKCKCSASHIGRVARAIYSHRGSQSIPLRSVVEICVAAADAKDHFNNVGEIWLVAGKSWSIPPEQRHDFICSKLSRDWKKTDPRIREMLNGTYEQAQRTLLEIANGHIVPAHRPARRLFTCTEPPP